jgi:hypothetical protein
MSCSRDFICKQRFRGQNKPKKVEQNPQKWGILGQTDEPNEKAKTASGNDAGSAKPME